MAGLITHRSGSATHWRPWGRCKESDRSRFLLEGAGRFFLPRQEENQRGCYQGTCCRVSLSLSDRVRSMRTRARASLLLAQVISSRTANSALEDFKPFDVGLRTVESMGVEELLPPAFTRFNNEVLRGWELLHKSQAAGIVHSSKAFRTAG
jgi:hypothetical protein